MYLDDPSYRPDHFVVLPKISATDRDLVRLANTLSNQMHPLNADEQFAKIEAVLAGLSGVNTEPHKAAALLVATDCRDAMKRMGEGRRKLGLHPVPDHLQHLLGPEER